MSRRSGSRESRKALDQWLAPDGAGEPLACIATSFTFDAAFFETECVARFLQMDTHPSESDSVAYLIEREEKLAATKVCALVDRRHARDKESLRWDIIGIAVPRAIQHAKLALLAWAKHVRVIIGSANLTEPGYRKNLEIVGTIDLSKTVGGDRTSIDETMRFLENLLQFAVALDGPDTAVRRVREAVGAVRRRIAGWQTTEPARRGVVPVLCLPGRGALAQMAERWPGGGPPRDARITSPFFDEPGRAHLAIEGLLGLMAKRGPREIQFAVRVEDFLDGRRRVYAPIGMVKRAITSADVFVDAVSRLQNDELRSLHAKIVTLQNDHWHALLVGSSNFTAAGLGVHARVGNVEANLLYLTRTNDRKLKRVDDIWPELEDIPLDPDDSNLIWSPETEELEDGVDLVPLPSCFADASFIPGNPPQLVITLSPELPQTWRITTANGRELLNAGKHDVGTHTIEWTEESPPFILEVFWTNGVRDCVASWPVNVSNPALLPPPEALRGLSLEELLTILASTRPLHEAVLKVLVRRRKMVPGKEDLDPLKRLDSQATLLRRTKRVAIALDHLRERLERPALTKDAYEWRINGPIGPMALAQAFAREASLPGEAQFYLCELALALSRVKPARAAAGGLRPAIIEELLSIAIGDLKARSAALATPVDAQPLLYYVSEAFAEAEAS